MSLTDKQAARFFLLCLEAEICGVEDVRNWAQEVIKRPGQTPSWAWELSVISPHAQNVMALRLARIAERPLSTETALALLAQLDYAFRIGHLCGRAAAGLLATLTCWSDLPKEFHYLGHILEHIYQGVRCGQLSERQANIEIGRQLGNFASFDHLVPIARSSAILRFVPQVEDRRVAV